MPLPCERMVGVRRILEPLLDRAPHWWQQRPPTIHNVRIEREHGIETGVIKWEPAPERPRRANRLRCHGVHLDVPHGEEQRAQPRKRRRDVDDRAPVRQVIRGPLHAGE